MYLKMWKAYSTGKQINCLFSPFCYERNKLENIQADGSYKGKMNCTRTVTLSLKC